MRIQTGTMHVVSAFLSVLLWLLLEGSAMVQGNGNNQRLDYYSTVCEISVTCAPPLDCPFQYCSESDGGHYYLSRGRAGLQRECGNAAGTCVVSEGMRLEVRCQQLVDNNSDDDLEDVLTLYVNGTPVVMEGDGSSNSSRSWAFATAERAEGLYECRWPNGSLFGNRSVIVEAGPQLIPDTSIFTEGSQISQEVTPGHWCHVALVSKLLTLYANTAEHYSLSFHVLGQRPLSLSVVTLWPDHYPVNLDLQWPASANATNSLHTIHFDVRDVAIVSTANPVNIYLSVTANNSISSTTTTCFHLQLIGNPTIYTNDSLLEDSTVTLGQPVTLSCNAQSMERISEDIFITFSVFFLIHHQSQNSSTECYRCDFTRRDMSCQSSEGNKGHALINCAGIDFSSSSSGLDLVKVHELTVRWPKVQNSDNQTTVICAIAKDHITQWVKSATLTILNTTPTPSPSTATPTTIHHPSQNYSRPLLALSGLVVLSFVMMVIFLVCMAAFCYLGRRKKGSHIHVPLSDKVGLTEKKDDETSSDHELPSPAHSLGEKERHVFTLSFTAVQGEGPFLVQDFGLGLEQEGD